MREIRPFETNFNVNVSSNTNLDAWYGARDFANSNDLKQYLTTKQDFEEFGGEYLKEHYASNRYFSTPAPIIIEATPATLQLDTSQSTIIKNLETDVPLIDPQTDLDTIKMEEDIFIE